jgi:hypothetical protein
MYRHMVQETTIESLLELLGIDQQEDTRDPEHDQVQFLKCLALILPQIELLE